MVLEKDSPLAAQFDEIAVDKTVEDGHHGLGDRHDEWAMKDEGEERNGNVSLGLLTRKRWNSKLGEVVIRLVLTVTVSLQDERIWKLYVHEYVPRLLDQTIEA